MLGPKHGGSSLGDEDGTARGVARAARSVAASAPRLRPRLHALLDAALVVPVGATFAQAGDPNVLMHGAWVVLAVEAFVFGLRGSFARIVLASLALVLYASLPTAPGEAGAPGSTPLEVTEWPLMVVIALLVAVMADRVTTTGRRYAELYRRASGRLLTAQEDERKRLALDLHDGVGQTLAALELSLDAALVAPTPAIAGERVRRAREFAALALEETRDAVFRLRPARIARTGLAAAIGDLAARCALTTSVSVAPAVALPRLLPSPVEVELLRIVQEALANAARHSHAERAWVEMRRVRQELWIEIGDDGVGFDPSAAAARGLGLAGMRDRASIIGATVAIATSPGRGTLVRIAIALPPGRADASAPAVPEAAAPLPG